MQGGDYWEGTGPAGTAGPNEYMQWAFSHCDITSAGLGDMPPQASAFDHTLSSPLAVVEPTQLSFGLLLLTLSVQSWQVRSHAGPSSAK